MHSNNASSVLQIAFNCPPGYQTADNHPISRVGRKDNGQNGVEKRKFTFKNVFLALLFNLSTLPNYYE